MFKNRKITVTVDKKAKEAAPTTEDPRSFERKAEFVLHHLKKTGVQMFAGVCIYVLLDTHRQVKVENAKHPTK